MTLILTALCKGGVCVCADKRYKLGGGSEPIRFEDDHKKIYEFKSISLIISNHGVNRFGNKYWGGFCLEYERSRRWVDRNLGQIADDFGRFVENSVKDQLDKYRSSEHIACFLVCGKTPSDDKFQVIELCWKINSGGKRYFEVRQHQGLVRSGCGGKYLDAIVDSSARFNNVNFWRNRQVAQARAELKKLFRIAIKRKKLAGGEEFSDGFDIKCITNKPILV